MRLSAPALITASSAAAFGSRCTVKTCHPPNSLTSSPAGSSQLSASAPNGLPHNLHFTSSDSLLPPLSLHFILFDIPVLALTTLPQAICYHNVIFRSSSDTLIHFAVTLLPDGGVLIRYLSMTHPLVCNISAITLL